METAYSFKKGLVKGLVSLLAIIGSLVALAGFSDITLWDLVVQYVKPLIGALTVGGVITVAVNFLKFRFL